jgi:hypothetical protein
MYSIHCECDSSSPGGIVGVVVVPHGALPVPPLVAPARTASALHVANHLPSYIN